MRSLQPTRILMWFDGESSQREPRSRGGSAGSSGTVKYPSLTGTRAPAIVVRPSYFGTGHAAGGGVFS